MPAARPRVAPDDSRSESLSAFSSLKERANGLTGIAKSRKSGLNTLDEPLLSFKGTVTGIPHDTMNGINGVIQNLGGTPQTDWSSLPASTLHTYRAAHKIQTPSSYSHPHADLLYNASEIGRRAPSQILARKTLRDLKAHRRKLNQMGVHSNGIHKTTSSRLKQKDKDRDETSSQSSLNLRRKQRGLNGNKFQNSIAQSIEPASPTAASQSAGSTSDQASSTLLNASDPESTIIGRQSPTLLATTIRKHFNAQQLNEAESIARFTYVVRQHGYGSGAVMKSVGTATVTNVSSNASAHATKVSIPVRVEGSAGDGDGWIMGSMGRQVRMSDTGSGGTFRLRFRP